MRISIGFGLASIVPSSWELLEGVVSISYLFFESHLLCHKGVCSEGSVDLLKRLYMLYRFTHWAAYINPNTPRRHHCRHEKDWTDLEENIRVSGSTSVPYIIKIVVNKCLAIDNPFSVRKHKEMKMEMQIESGERREKGK